jgi:metal-responsive CopG/Arc/MetJ family transcriptional regulator
MAKSIAKKRPGRPATGRDPVVTTRLPEELIKSLDAWAEKEGMTRGEAMRWIIDQFFKKRSATGLI